MKLQNYETTKHFSATGSVYGNYYGGGSGWYPSIDFYGDTLDELELKANKALEDGSIDSGMGFESIKGALLYVVETTFIEVEGHIFSNKAGSELILGELPNT